MSCLGEETAAAGRLNRDCSYLGVIPSFGKEVRCLGGWFVSVNVQGALTLQRGPLALGSAIYDPGTCVLA